MTEAATGTTEGEGFLLRPALKIHYKVSTFQAVYFIVISTKFCAAKTLNATWL
jgi:hypothetical protein